MSVSMSKRPATASGDDDHQQPAKKYVKADITRLLADGEASIQLPKKRSDIWKKFGHPVVAGSGVISEFAACSDCHAVYLYNSKKGNGPLIQHKCSGQKPLAQNSIVNFLEKKQPKVKKLSLEDSNKINRAAIKTCAMDMRPLSVFSNPGILSFCQELVDTAASTGRFDVTAELAHPTTLCRTHLTSLYTELRQEAERKFNTIDGMAHTSDMWQEKYTGNQYMSLSCHYITEEFEFDSILWETIDFPYEKKTAENILTWYTSAIPCPNLLHFSVSDNASNMNAAYRSVNGIACSSHCINLVVQGIISSADSPDTKILVDAAKALVGHIKKANLQGKLPRRVSQSMCVRWNSTLTMLESLIAVWPEVSQLLIDRGEGCYLSGLNKARMEETIVFLKEFKIASDELERDRKPTLHRVLYYYCRLKKHVSPEAADSEYVATMKQVGSQLLPAKWERRIQDIHFAALLLDPRAKNTAAITALQKERGIRKLREILLQLDSIEIDVPAAVPDLGNDMAVEEDDFYATTVVPAVQQTLSEVDYYLQVRTV